MSAKNNQSALTTLVTVFFFWGFIAASNGVFIPFCKTYFNIDQFQWLPASCAYRRIVESQPLPEWHPLLTGNSSAMHAGGHSVRGKVIVEYEDVDLEDHVAIWPSL